MRQLGRIDRWDALGDIGGKSLGSRRRSAKYAVVELVERNLVHGLRGLEWQSANERQ
jgi:hypothetical protein